MAAAEEAPKWAFCSWILVYGVLSSFLVQSAATRPIDAVTMRRRAIKSSRPLLVYIPGSSFPQGISLRKSRMLRFFEMGSTRVEGQSVRSVESGKSPSPLVLTDDC
jgi:hypothetical protein